MAEVSRTARVIQNAKVALLFYCINLALQFFSRKIFLDCLGAELLGLNTTAQNLLQFLNLAESGIGAAVAFALYKPLSQGNRQEIIDIVSLQGWFYRWVGIIVIAGSVVLMAFFPWIFAKAQVPLIYAYGTYIAFLISALLGYFVNYKMIVLSADQKEYKITIETQSVKVIKVLIQMVAIWKLPHGYVWWIFLEVLAAFISSIRITGRMAKEYPWLVTDISRGKNLKMQYSYVMTKTKQLIFHRLGNVLLWQTTPIIIYAFTTLTMVAIYGNYVLILGGCLMLVEALSRGLNAGVGNLVISASRKEVKRIFWQLTTIRLFFAGFICTGFFFLSRSFTILWVGEDYVMPAIPMTILTAVYFIQMSRTCDIFLNAYGLFQDIWAPIVESLLNIVLSLLLGYFYDLAGILMGVLLSQILMVSGWKGYFLYKHAFREDAIEYVRLSVKKVFIILVISCSCFILTIQVEDWGDWIYHALCLSLLYLSLGTVLLYFFDSHFASIIYKMSSLFKNTLNK